MIFASIGNNQADLQIGYWSGSVWINDANADTSCNKPVPGSKYVTTGWLINGSTTRSVINYVDSGSATIDWFTGNLGTFTKQSDVSVTPSYSNPNGTLNIEMNPSLKDRLMYTFSDKNNSLFAKRLVMGATGIFTWTDSDSIALTTTLPQTTNRPFSFAFLRN